MEKTLFAVDELSGFITAVAYVRPEGIHGMTPKSVKKKLKQPSFAAAVNRDELRAGADLVSLMCRDARARLETDGWLASVQDARRVFFASIIYLPLLWILMIVDKI
jgi:hypothetical protein